MTGCAGKTYINTSNCCQDCWRRELCICVGFLYLVGGDRVEILKVFNNNVALARDDEIVVMGKGLAFGKRAGDTLASDKVEKTFVLKDTSAGIFADLYQSTAPEVVDALLQIVDEAEESLNINLKSNAYIALADHINFALNRHQEGISLVNPLSWEVRNFYPQEQTLGLRSLDIIEGKTGIRLEESEATAIALHLVNASMQGDRLEHTVKMTRIVGDILNIVRNYFSFKFDETSITYSRFLTHLQFFAQRIVKGMDHQEGDSFLYDQVKASYPAAFQCTERIRDYADKVHDFQVSQDEQVYLAIHIQRTIAHK